MLVAFDGAFAINRSAVADHLRIRGYEGAELEALYDRITHMAQIYIEDVLNESKRIAEREREAQQDYNERHNGR